MKTILFKKINARCPSITSNSAKIINILVISLSSLPYYFAGLTKLFSHLYPVKFLNILVRRLSIYSVVLYIQYFILSILIYIQ